MRGKKLLAAFLLGVSLCFVPALGYGEVQEWLYKEQIPAMSFLLLKLRVTYMMHNPISFLNVDFYYDADGKFGRTEGLPEGIDTKGKIYVMVIDNRDYFSHKSRRALLNQFKRAFENIYSFIKPVATDMDTDVVAKFYTREETPLGYFYQGEYHLQGE